MNRLSLSVVIAALIGTSLTAGAQTTESVRIQQLEQRLGTLEQQLTQVSSGSGQSSNSGLPLHGFADVSWGKTRNKPNDDGSTGGAVGSVDFYLTPEFGDRVKSLIELVFEVDADGSLATDLERVQIGYTFADAATGWLGRFHTPYGYWNTAFHHGQQIQTALNRPRFLDFEDKGGILPAHATGVWLTGMLPISGNKLGYDVYSANAPEIAVEGSIAGGDRGALDMKMGGKANNNFSAMTGFNLSVRPGVLPDLTLGIHGLQAKITAFDSSSASIPVNSTKLNIVGGYAVFQDDSLELMTEYYRFNNKKEADGSRHKSTAWYAQVGYVIGRYTPYVRFEKTTLDTTDDYFRDQESGDSYQRSALGVRYDLNAKASLKVEALRTRFATVDNAPVATGQQDDTEARLQLAVRF